MTNHLDSIWDIYVKHRSLNQLQEDTLTDPWYEPPKSAGESILMRAVQSRDLGAVKLLLSCGESPHLPASDGFTFVHQAVDEISAAKADTDRDAAFAVLIALLEGGAPPNCQGQDGTPLHRAAEKRRCRSRSHLVVVWCGYGSKNTC